MSRIKQLTLYLTSVPKYQNSLSLKYSWFVLVAPILTVSIQWRIQVLFGARLYSGIQKSSVTQIASFPRTSSPQRTQVIGRKPAPWSWCLMPVYIMSLPNTRWGIVGPWEPCKSSVGIDTLSPLQWKVYLWWAFGGVCVGSMEDLPCLPGQCFSFFSVAFRNKPKITNYLVLARMMFLSTA